MFDTIYPEPGEDYPSEDVQELEDIIAMPVEEYPDSKYIPELRLTEALDEHVAKRNYAFATRQEKYDLYRRFRDTLEPDCLHPNRHKFRKH